ncbi:MAG TPA: hypothetical protein DCM08_00325 [Microscillaceae bacterium]|jgi:hypothetical protein|nr:hypothetical protein [Microscillaceae bacterium]
MSDSNTNSRKWLTTNTGAFVVSSIPFFLYMLKGNSFVNLLSLVGYGYFGVYFLITAWKAHTDLEYSKSQTRGLFAWLYPAVVTAIRFLI